MLCIAASLSLASRAAACPLPAVSDCPSIDGYIDYNCDGLLKIVAFGDSVVSGRGDTDNGEKGGYVLRLKKRMQKRGVSMTIVGAGYAGMDTVHMLRKLQREMSLPGMQAAEKALMGADLVVIDMGRNDWWLGVVPGFTARNLKRIANLTAEMAGEGLFPPLVVIAKLIPSECSSKLPRKPESITQQQFMQQLNAALLLMNQDSYPAAVPFNKLPPYGYLQDPPRLDAGVHPTSKGYARLTVILDQFLRKAAQQLMEQRRPDADGDGIFDYCQ